MEPERKDPRTVVEKATVVLSRISSLCALMMSLDDHDSIPPADVSQVMVHFHLCLNEQIKALDGIQWSQ